MNTTRHSTNCQITLPMTVRASLASGSDAEFTAEEPGGGILVRHVARFPETALEEVAGCLRSKRKSDTPERMHDAIGREAMRRHDRGRY